MTPEERVLCLATRQDFLPAHREEVEAIARARPVRWLELARIARDHGVLPIAGANLRRCDLPLPEGLPEQLEGAVLESAARAARDGERLAAALARLREVRLEALLLKGAALRVLVYDGPWVVSSRDLDLALHPAEGWAFRQAGEREVRRALYLDGIECDLEGHHDVTLNGVLPVPFQRVWIDAVPVRFQGEEARVPSPEDLLISLSVNACRKRYFRLKCLFDLAESLRRLASLDWDLLSALAREARCEGIVWAALAATRETVGCDLPPRALERLGVSPGRERVLGALVRAAVRGRPLAGGRRTAAALLAWASLHGRDALRAAGRTALQRRRRPPAREAGRRELAPPATPARS